jgi:hypothetical protein
MSQKIEFFITTTVRTSYLTDLEISCYIYTVKRISSLSYYKLKQHKQWFDKGCSKPLDWRKQAKFQWSQDPSQINGDNLNSLRRSQQVFQEQKEGISERIH